MPNETTETTETTTPTSAIVDANKNADAGNSTLTKVDENKSDEGKTFTSDYVKDLRKESADYRQKAKDLQKKAEEAERKAEELGSALKATKQETEQALNESKRLNHAVEQRFINAELKAAALEEGLVDLDAFKMVDISKIKITDKGEVTGIQEVIAELKKDKSYLFKEVSTSNKNSVAPPADANPAEKPTYESPQQLAAAKRKYLASLR